MKNSLSSHKKPRKKTPLKRSNDTKVKTIKLSYKTLSFDENCADVWLNKFKNLDNGDKTYILDFEEAAVDSCFLGQGGSGFVFKYQTGGNQYAIKFLINKNDRNKEVKKIVAIQDLFKSSKSKNYRITQYIEKGDTSIQIDTKQFRLYYIVMDLADGTINELMCEYHKNGEKDTSKLINQIKHLSETIQVLHESKFAHRDIKPENILLKGELPILADFGLSGCIKEQKIRKKGPKYWPNPEFVQACDKGLQDIDEQSDIFNLGCLFFYFFTGKYPIGLIDIETELSCVDETIKELLIKMLSYSKEDRLVDINDAIKILENAV